MKNWIKLLGSIAVVIFFTMAVEAASFREDRLDRREYSSRRSEHPMSRVRAVMLPLLRVTNRRIDYDNIQVSIVDDPAINAANAGEGRYYVTTGLLNRASDDQLRGVLAHEIAHEDLGHAAKAQMVGTGLSLGVALLEQLFPGSSSFTPLAGSLITNNYTRPLELEADRHAVELLERAGYSKHTMINTLDWLMRRNGDSGGGILSTHPATSERIQALRSLR
ncbi:MAG: M48 family metallopeptidase [Candidatus Binatia bacterium]